MKPILIPVLVLGALASSVQAEPVSLDDSHMDRITAGSSNTFNATILAATTIRATTLGATTLGATTLGATTVKATTLGATTLGSIIVVK